MTDTAKVIHFPALQFGRLTEVGHVRRELAINVPEGVSLETVLQPTYLKHYARDIRPADIIEALCEDGSWEASLRVMYVSTAEVRMQVRWQTDYDEMVEDEPESDTHEVKWKGPAMKFAVVRKDNKEIIQSGFYPKSDAHNFMAKHLANLKT